MALTWRKSYELGNPVIDAQHKQLVDTFNELMDECYSGAGQDKLESTLNFLCNYVVEHFKDEEEWQAQINYPEYEEHKQIHEACKAKAAELIDEFKKDGPTSAVISKLNYAIGEWVVNHIRMDDAKIASYRMMEKYSKELSDSKNSTLSG